MRRVVITGVGLITPLAGNRDATWERLLAGKSGANKIEHLKVDDLPCRIACLVPRVDGRGGGAGDPHAFDPDKTMSPKEQRRVDDLIIYGMAAANEAIADSGYVADTEEKKVRAGVLMGSGIGGLGSIEANAILLEKEGPRKISPFFIPGALINLISGQVSIRHGLKGPNHAVVTACATGAHAIGDASRLIKNGDADVMVAGGAEAAVVRLGMAGFCALRALSTGYNETPEKASRPYDKDRDGFVMGEGGGAVVLEEYEHAKARGAKIYAEIKGYGLSGDAYHITAPTPLGDEIELKAVERLFGNSAANLSLSSTKSAIGHLLGAAGAVESIFCALAIRDGIVPPTLNLDNPSVETAIDLTPHKAKRRPVKAAMSNSFGFGGTNAAVILTAVD
jgi:3-oxoacyl-[acyl-carrier-protein] synthase II